MLDGWGRPGRVLAARAHLRVVQVDAWRSPGASLADEWIAVEPGGEGALALALSRLVAQGTPGRLTPEALDALAPFTPERVAARTGVEAARIVALARSLADRAPTVALGGGDPGGGPLGRDAERAIAILNVALGSVGAPGGFVPRRALPGGPEPDGAPARASRGRSRRLGRARSSRRRRRRPRAYRGPPSHARSRRGLSS